MKEHTTSECWHLASTHLTPDELARLRKHRDRALPGTPWMSSHEGRLIVEVPPDTHADLPLNYPWLAACLAVARRHGYRYVSFASDGDHVDELLQHEGRDDDPARSLAARRRLWLVRTVVSEIGVAGQEVAYAQLCRDVARTAYAPRVLLVARRSDVARLYHINSYGDRAAATAAVLGDPQVVLAETFIIDLETWARFRPVPAVDWEATKEEVEIPLLCPECGNERVSELGTAEAYGQWLRRGGETEFEGQGDTETHWDDRFGAPRVPCTCSCGWSGRPEQLVPIYESKETQND